MALDSARVANAVALMEFRAEEKVVAAALSVELAWISPANLRFLSSHRLDTEGISRR